MEHRVDQLNNGSNASRTELTGLTSFGVILWRLSFSEESELWCLVFQLSGGWYLVLDEDPLGTAPYALDEQHEDIASVVHRAETLRLSLLRCGWKEIDVE